MRREELLFYYAIIVVTLVSHSNCATNGASSSGGTRICAACQRPIPTRPVEEDLYHLKHADPCHKIKFQPSDSALPDPERGPAVSRCNALVNLYLKSELYYGGRGSKCLNAKSAGCVNYSSDWDLKYHCRVEIPGRFFFSFSWKRLAECVEEDYAWYIQRTRVYGAQFTPAQTPRAEPQIGRIYGAHHPVEEVPRAQPQIQRPRERGRSASPPRGRSKKPSFSASSLLGSGSHKRRSKSNSPTRPLLCDFT